MVNSDAAEVLFFSSFGSPVVTCHIPCRTTLALDHSVPPVAQNRDEDPPEEPAEENTYRIGSRREGPKARKSPPVACP